MVGLAGKLVAVGFFAIAMLITLAYIPDIFGNLVDGDFFTATTLKVKPEANETICDLRVKTNADLTQDVNIGLLGIDSKPKVTIVLGESHSYTWFNCVAQQQYTANDLINAGGGTSLLDPEDLTQNVFFTSGGLTLNGKIAIIDANDPTQRVDSILQNQLSRSITFDSFQTVETPFNVDIEYVIADIPIREYDLEIFYDGSFITGINEMGAGQPFDTKVCNNFQKFENNRCVPLS